MLARAKALDLRLSACALARWPRRAGSTVAQLKAGMVRLDGFAMAAGAPFGGTGFSGLRCEGGPEGLDAYLDIKLAQVV